ncbi:MAG: amidohydrolase family protein [Gammaproteobacteria bacterium]
MKFTYEERGWGLRPMIPRLPLPLLRHLIEYYNEHGVRSTVHVSGESRAREAIYAGVDTLAHPVIQGPVSDAFVKLMAARGTPMASTLTIGENYSRLAEHPEFLDEPLYAATVDAAERRQLMEVDRPRYAADQWTWWMKLMTPVAQENLRRIVAAGGIVALGTDQSSGPAVHRELELLVAGGIPPQDALRIATLNAARFLGRDATLGSIEEGKIADLLLVEADPRADIRNLRRIVQVVKAGVVVNRDALQLPVNAGSKARSP